MKLRAVSSEWFPLALLIRSCALTWSWNKWQHEHMVLQNTCKVFGRVFFLSVIISFVLSICFSFSSHSYSILFLSFLRVVFYSSFVFLQLYISLLHSIPMRTAVAQWLRYCATNRKVVVSIPHSLPQAVDVCGRTECGVRIPNWVVFSLMSESVFIEQTSRKNQIITTQR
jgi:hypothetical protein